MSPIAGPSASLPLSDKQINHIADAICDKLNRTVLSDIRGEIGELRSEMHAEIGELRSEMRAENAQLRADMCAGFAEVHAGMGEMRREMGEIRGIVGELCEAVASIDYKVEQVGNELRVLRLEHEALQARVEP